MQSRRGWPLAETEPTGEESMEDLTGVCGRAVELATAAGADEAEAFAVEGRLVNVELQKNDIQIAKSMSGKGLGIRVFKNRSLGFAYVNSFDEPSMAESVERAIGISSAAPSDEHNGLPEPMPIEFVDRLYDESAERYGVGEAVEQSLAMLGTARDYDPRVTVDGGGLFADVGSKAVVSTRGVRAVERGSLFYCYIMGMARDGESVSSFDFQFDNSRFADGFDPVPCARRFAENAVASLGAVKGESFEGPVILSPKAAANIIAYPIAASVLASSVQKETSRFRGKLGQVVASDLLTVRDDASLRDGFGTTSFDREGLQPRALPLIDGGVLVSFLYDSYTARKEGRDSTGHAGGGAASVPAVSTTNVIIEAGETALDDMIAGIDLGILVTRFSGNISPVSGDFSGVVKGGRMIRAGKLAEPLCGTMIAGNSFELMRRISAVSRESERLFSTVAPYVALEGVKITSG